MLSGNVNLNNVTVKGDIIVGGGNVTLDGVTAMNLIVSNPMGIKPTVIATGSTNIGTAEVQSSASLSESGLSANAGGFSDVTVTGEGASLSLDASVWDLDTKAASTIVTTGSTLISELTADAKTTVTGNGSVQTAKLNASGCELVMQPAEVQLRQRRHRHHRGQVRRFLDERFGLPRPPCPSTSTTRTTSPFPTNFCSMRTRTT